MMMLICATSYFLKNAEISGVDVLYHFHKGQWLLNVLLNLYSFLYLGFPLCIHCPGSTFSLESWRSCELVNLLALTHLLCLFLDLFLCGWGRLGDGLRRFRLLPFENPRFSFLVVVAFGFLVRQDHLSRFFFLAGELILNKVKQSSRLLLLLLRNSRLPFNFLFLPSFSFLNAFLLNFRLYFFFLLDQIGYCMNIFSNGFVLEDALTLSYLSMVKGCNCIE